SFIAPSLRRGPPGLSGCVQVSGSVVADAGLSGRSSLVVATRMGLTPLPGRADHLGQAASPGGPAEDFAGALGRGDQDWRVARPARADRVRHRLADDLLGCGEDLANAEARTRSQVEPD